MENINVYIKGRDEPFVIANGEYLGHKRPDGKITDNWHYYKSCYGEVFHFRKQEMQAVITRQD